MNIQKIAKTVLLAHEVIRAGVEEEQPVDVGAAFIASCEEFNVDRRIGLLLYYANLRPGSLHQWAVDVLENV